MLPLLGARVATGAALRVVFAADALSIATMEAVDSAVMARIPGAMGVGLVTRSSGLMRLAGHRVRRGVPRESYLLERGKGHALTHQYHSGHDMSPDHDEHAPRRGFSINTVTLAVALAAFMIGGLVVSIADSSVTVSDMELVVLASGV